jgi:anthranilate phosphoribosyltransferase
MRAVLDDLIAGLDLVEGAATEVFEAITSPDADPVMTGAVLVALKAKGETSTELRAFATALRQRAVRPPLGDVSTAVDVVGTGGDRSGSLNLSTGAALVTAGCGQKVVKHGNRSVSSRSGSADVLAALGLKIPLDGDDAAALLDASGFTFLFAPHYHPAMKSVASVRSALGVGTIFNLVGPLANPATPGFAVIGANSLDTARRLAGALAGMGVERVFVVHGSAGWDEPTPIGPYHLIEVTPGEIRESVEDPAEMGMARCDPTDLAGGDAVDNASALRRVIEGEAGPHRDALVLGASLALRVAGVAADAREALAEAASAIDDGRAGRVLERVSGFEGAKGSPDV